MPTVAMADGTSFSDVPETYDFYSSVQWMAQSGITTGWEDGTFRPYESVSRGAFLTFLYRLAGEPAFTAPKAATFADVPVTHPFYKEISWAVQYGIAKGWDDGTFRPEAPIARDALAAFMFRFACAEGADISSESAFTDVPTDYSFFKEIMWMNNEKLAGGWADGTYRPLEATERGAVAVFLHRFSTQGRVMMPFCKGKIVANAPTFSDGGGTARDTFTIPETEGVTYFVNGRSTPAGTYRVSGHEGSTANVIITASPDGNHWIEGRSQWGQVFSSASRWSTVS